MGFINDHFDEFNQSLAKVDATLEEHCAVDKKTDELLRFALSIKARSAGCVRKHFRGAKNAGASLKEIAYVFALTMREAAGADDCWTQDVISDIVEEEAKSDGSCGCADKKEEKVEAAGCCE